MKVPKPRRLPSGTWRVQLRIGGESVNVNAATEKEATRQAQIVKAEYLAGKRKKAEPASSLTLSAAIDQYCADRSNQLSPATVRKYHNIRDNQWPELMQRPLDKISSRQWQQAVNDALGRYSHKTVSVSLGMTKTVVTACGVEFPSSVALGRSSAQKAKEADKVTFLEPDQIPAFVEAVKDTKFCIPLLLALSSLRIEEIDGLDWKDVVVADDHIGHTIVRIRRVRIQNEEHKWILKEGAKTAGSVRDVPILIPALSAALQEARQPEGKLMTCCQDALRRNCKKICESAGIPYPGIHGLRHSFASLCASPQVSVPELISQQIGGWENDKVMKQIYTHVAQADLRAALSRLTAFYSTKPESKNAHENAHASETL